MKLIRTGRKCLLVPLLMLVCCIPVAAQEPSGERDNKQAARLVQALNSRFYRERREARRKLAAMGPAAVKPLLGALKSNVSGIRSNAAFILGCMKVREAMPQLLDLVDDPSLEVRREAVEALGQVGREAVDLLRAHLEGAKGRRKEFIEQLLGRALTGAVTEYLDNMRITSRSFLYCPGLIEMLKLLGPGVLEALKRLSDWSNFQAQPDWQRMQYICYYALNTIGDLGDPAAKDFLKKMYKEAKVSGSLVYRAGAAMALAKLGEQSQAQEIIRDIKLDIYTTSEQGKHSSLGATYLEIGKLDKAEEHFLKARELQPEEMSYTFRLGCVYGCKGDAVKAVAHLEEVVEKKFIKASVLSRIGYFQKIRESDEWKKFMEEAMEKEKAAAEKEEEKKESEEEKEE